MTYPKEYFDAAPEPERPGTCFVLMPFAPEFDRVYEAIRGAMQRADVGFACRRADELFGGDQIMAGVLREISSAQLVVAELTGRNPNVFYELGLAHMVKNAKRVLLLSQRTEDVPFDLRAYRCIIYTPDEDGLMALQLRVKETARAVAGRTYRFTVIAGGSHSTPPLFPGPDRYLYSVEIEAAMCGYDFVKALVSVFRHGAGQDATPLRQSGYESQAGYGFSVGEAREIASFPWLIRLDDVTDNEATFTVIQKDSEQDGG